MLVDSLLPRIAGELGLTIVAPLRGGEFGAEIVRDRDGQELVLKASSAARVHQLARAAALTERLRERGYPAPVYVATGMTRGASWSLQERLPGRMPATLTMPLASRLVELARSHARVAQRDRRWQRQAFTSMRAWKRHLVAREDTRRLTMELAEAARRCAGVEVRSNDVIHNDFSHRNCLAIGDEVTGIIDWEQAGVGDWRLDLVTLAYWAALQRARVPDDVRRMLRERVQQECPAELSALFAAYQALRHLDYEARAHPEHLPLVMSAIETRVAPLWRRRSPRGSAYAVA
jgi:aminoglycoside phosphotransferase (APT) family kinase protein